MAMSERIMLGNQLRAQGKCPRCGAATQKAFYLKTGRNAWLDAEPSSNGRIFLDPHRMEYTFLKMPEVERAIRDGTPLYVNHHATCEVEIAERAQQKAQPKEPNRTGNVVDFRTRKVRW